MRRLAASCLGMGIPLFAFATSGAAKDELAPPPTVVREIARCRVLTNDKARLECFDAAADRLSAAVTSKEVYVLDRTQVRETRRKLFGLPLPSEGVISNQADASVQIDRIEGIVMSASQTFDGNWRVTLDQGGIWEQTDGYQLAHGPRKGDKVVVTRAALGSYKMKIGSQATVRVRRVG